MSPSEPLLQIHELDARYGPIQALRQVSLYIDAGEIVTLIGANGAGKSTLLMSLFGDPRPAGGWVRYQGHDITGLPTHEIAKRGIAQAPEGRRIFAAMSVEENLLMGAIPVGMDHMDADLIKVFELFPRLKERRHQRAGTLSGGEQQMLAIGRALMSRPRLLLLDEPSLGLAPLMVRRIFATIQEIRDSGATIFLVEQNAHHALKLAQRGYVLVNGEIRLSGTGEELLADPEVRRAYLGGRG
ncbi:MAG: ABC transporter ATP-binding protein [Candidatus Competibacteraceae bacterium]|nr:ABC transporter ATP-binding protein [Candidatus Competibacteraceae bacterium]